MVATEDYSKRLNGLPKSDVLKYFYQGDAVSGSMVIRSSGTETKLKDYISVTVPSADKGHEIEKQIKTEIDRKL